MPDRTDLIYRYDGTLKGLLCCVYECFSSKENPMMILPKDEMQLMLLPEKVIETDPAIALRVANAITGKLSEEFMRFVASAHLCALAGREGLIVALIRRGFRQGARVLNDLGDPAVNKLMRAVNALANEAHLYLGFTRFQVTDGVLTSVIEPKNRVLPLMRAHFCDRFSGETFLIYDKTHAQALIYHLGVARIESIQSLQLPAEDEVERHFRALWRLFFKTVSIASRENPQQQQTHLPQRYRSQMPELTPPTYPKLQEIS
ncbi:MAG: TIGR03915 family putative DNA repair protein [Clostridia bacterium]